MFVSPPQIQMWKPNPQGVVLGGGPFGRSLGHESGALINGISALIEEALESSLDPFAMQRHREKSATWKRALISDFQPQNCEK